MQLQDSNYKLDEPKIDMNPTQALEQWLINQLADQLSLDPSTIKVSESLTRYGLDSIDAVTLVGDLEDWLDLELPDTLFWDYPTIEKASQYLADNYELDSALANAQTPELTTANVSPSTPETDNNQKKGWGLWGRLKG